MARAEMLNGREWGQEPINRVAKPLSDTIKGITVS